MVKKHQEAFNKAYTQVLRSKKRSLLLNKKTKSYDVVVPLAEITKAFKKFIDIVEKDLKIGKYRPIPKTKAKANNKQEKRK